ncbi:MAG: presenilin family intramembrane aspartyl protease PSH [Thermoplasmatota archaeon]
MSEPAPAPMTDSASDASKEPLPITRADYYATAALLGMFVVTIVLAVAFAKPFVDAELQAFDDPDDATNSIGYIGLLLVFTFAILWIAKKGKKWMIQVIILGAVGSTMVYLVPPFAGMIGIPATASWLLGIAVGIACAVGLWKYPEWWVIDSVGVLVAAGAASLFGISLNVLPVIVLLVGLAIYDAIAVYRTKHMLALADTVMDLRLPILLVIPKQRGYSFLKEVAQFKKADESEGESERDALFMGLGDLVMPTILVVSAVTFDWPAWAAWGAALGTLWGYLMLMATVLQGKPQAGLPLLNGGAILGFLLGLYAATGSIVFW